MKNKTRLLIGLMILISYSVFPQWIQQSLPGYNNVVLGIDFINQNHGILGGWYGGIPYISGNAFYTNNGGINWVAALIPDSMRVIVEVQMINDSLVYGAGAYNLIPGELSTESKINGKYLNHEQRNYSEFIGMDFSGQQDYRGFFVETTNGGLSWHPKGSFGDSVYYLIGLYFVDPQTGYVIASGPGSSSNALLNTTDGGNSWHYVLPFQEGIFIRAIRWFSGIGYMIYENSILERVFFISTTDGGATWTSPIQPGLLSASKVAFANEHTILISGINNQFKGTLVMSTDYGISWQLLRSYDNKHNVAGVDAVWNSNTLLVYGLYQSTSFAYLYIDISIDLGNNWNYSGLPQFRNYMAYNSKMVDEQNWYLIGTIDLQQGFVLYTDNTTIKEGEKSVAVSFQLYQNYPNPFNPVTTIKYSIPIASNAKLEILNILGEQVELLVNETKPVGSYEAIWDASNMSSGIYFYRIQAGDFLQTRKMVLMK